MATAPFDRIPPRQKFLFSLGVNMEYVATTLMTSVLWIPYFNLGLGLSPAALGVVLMILRAWDAVSDPVMGGITDNARTRWGRRRPFIVVGAVLTAGLFPLFWYVPLDWSGGAQLTYLGFLGVLFFTCFTIWSMPYYAMQMELTSDFDERTRLSAWCTVVSKGSYLAGSWVLAFVSGPLFADPETGKGDIVAGMRVACWIMAAAILVFGLAPALVNREPVGAATIAKTPAVPFWTNVRESLACRPLWPLIGVSFFLVLGYTSVGALTNYIYIYHVFDGDINAGSVLFGWRNTVNVVVGLATIPLLTWLSTRYDKRTMVLATLLVCVVGHLLNWILLDPERPYLLIIPAALESCGISAVWLFLPAMKADVADHDEVTTRRRREGSLNAFYSWFIKASLTASVGVGGFVLQISGFVAKAEHQPQAVLDRMFALYLWLPVAFWGIALVFAWFYPLTRGRMADIRDTLEARKNTAAVAPV